MLVADLALLMISLPELQLDASAVYFRSSVISGTGYVQVLILVGKSEFVLEVESFLVSACG